MGWLGAEIAYKMAGIIQNGRHGMLWHVKKIFVLILLFFFI